MDDLSDIRYIDLCKVLIADLPLHIFLLSSGQREAVVCKVR